MPISDVLRNNQTARPTNQFVADFMLLEDQARRAALRRGDAKRAQEHEAELSRLASELT